MTSKSHFSIEFTDRAQADYDELTADGGLQKRLKAVNKALAFLEVNPKHQSLNTHKFTTKIGPNGEDVFEAYAENQTPAAYRIFWYYGPGKQTITVVAITPHP